MSINEIRDIFDTLITGLDEAGIAQRVQKLEGYMDEILELNQHINLTAITDRTEFIRKHYADSLLCAGHPEFRSAQSVIDVGTGGGFPGVPLAIVFPEKEFVLIDSLNKRIRIINDLCAKLGIANVRAVHGRAEELARRKEMRESFDLCVSRAVANMSTLSEYCLPFVKVGGYFMAYKGPDCDRELAEAENAVRALGGRVDRIESPSADGLDFDHRNLSTGGSLSPQYSATSCFASSDSVDSAPIYAFSGSIGESDISMNDRILTAITSVSILPVVEQIYFIRFISFPFINNFQWSCRISGCIYHL